jgi:ubiquinone/menaquinone biosynthesis C-methylase UbiE
MRTASEIKEDPVPCTACGSVNFRPHRKALSFDPPHEPVYLSQCTQCGLVRTDPLQSDEELSSLYESTYYTSGEQKFSSPAEYMVRRFIGVLARQIIKATQTNASLPPKVLELGCGRGLLLKELHKAGCSCTGLERPDFPAEAIGNDITFTKGSAYDTPFSDNSFDIVVLWYLLEHVSAPSRVLQEANRVLRQGGVLFVAVPNINSWQARFFGKYWFHLDVPRHAHHFSTQTLSTALKRAGFKAQTQQGVSPEQSVFGFVQSAINTCAPNRQLNRMFFKLKQPNHLGVLIELGCWAVFAALLLPFALMELLFSRRPAHCALIKITATK